VSGRVERKRKPFWLKMKWRQIGVDGVNEAA